MLKMNPSRSPGHDEGVLAGAEISDLGNLIEYLPFPGGPGFHKLDEGHPETMAGGPDRWRRLPDPFPAWTRGGAD